MQVAGSRAGVQRFHRISSDSIHLAQQRSDSDEKGTAWCLVIWQQGANAANLIGSSRCADDNEDDGGVKVTHWPLVKSHQKAYLTELPHASGMLASI